MENSSLNTIRNALFEDGKDKNVLNGINPNILKYDHTSTNSVSIEFSAQLSEDDLDWTFEMIKENMENIYDRSGYGWDDDDKLSELTEDGARFLLVRDVDKYLVGVVHFRFTVQGEVMDVMKGGVGLYIWDIHLDASYQSKGLGRHLMFILELIARQQNMELISIPIQLCDEKTMIWISTLKGYQKDEELRSLINFDPDLEGFEVYSKYFPKSKVVTINAINNVLNVTTIATDHTTENKTKTKNISSEVNIISQKESPACPSTTTTTTTTPRTNIPLSPHTPHSTTTTTTTTTTTMSLNLEIDENNMSKNIINNNNNNNNNKDNLNDSFTITDNLKTLNI